LNKFHAIILAGGFATRLWPLTENLPKPLVPVGGRPLLDFIFEKLPPEIPVTISTNAVFAPQFEKWRADFLGANRDFQDSQIRDSDSSDSGLEFPNSGISRISNSDELTPDLSRGLTEEKNSKKMKATSRDVAFGEKNKNENIPPKNHNRHSEFISESKFQNRGEIPNQVRDDKVGVRDDKVGVRDDKFRVRDDKVGVRGNEVGKVENVPRGDFTEMKATFANVARGKIENENVARDGVSASPPPRKIGIFVEPSGGETEKFGALRATAEVVEKLQIRENIFLLAGDNFFGFSLAEFLAKFDGDPILAAKKLENKNDAKKFGVILPGENCAVKKFFEKPENPPSDLISTGAVILPANLISKVKEFSQKNPDDFGKIFEHFLAQKIPVKFFPFEENWFDIGSFTDFLAAHAEILRGENLLESSARAENSQLSGNVFLGKNSIVQNSFLQNCVVLHGAKIQNCELRNCVVGANSVLQNVDLNRQILRDGSFLVFD
jgi:glucose-1-phosphate thymidylyltransferase